MSQTGLRLPYQPLLPSPIPHPLPPPRLRVPRTQLGSSGVGQRLPEKLLVQRVDDTSQLTGGGRWQSAHRVAQDVSLVQHIATRTGTVIP
ncbi:hypothetical protein GUI43_03324 [Micromonospora noduli]|nr:hypothetical protein GUI43_03324 [Micromonospora noduli]